MSAQVLQHPLRLETLEAARCVISRPDDFTPVYLRIACEYLRDYGDFVDHTRAVALLDQLEVERLEARETRRSFMDILRGISADEWVCAACLVILLLSTVMYALGISEVAQ